MTFNTDDVKTARFPAIKRQPAEQLTADELRRLIISGQLPPGTRVTEADLAGQFEVSRGTLRNALRQLCQEGLILQTPYTGWTVMSVLPNDVWELYTLRATLESMAARLASERLTAEGAESLRAAYAELQEARRTRQPQEVVAEKDFQIHKTIVELAGHKRLREQYRMVEQQIRLFVASTYVGSTNPKTTLEHHKPIVDAVLRRDADEAARLIEEHSISEGMKRFKQLASVLSLGAQPAAR
jgi:DNA-binding GntR family transcriptional regulator